MSPSSTSSFTLCLPLKGVFDLKINLLHRAGKPLSSLWGGDIFIFVFYRTGFFFLERVFLQIYYILGIVLTSCPLLISASVAHASR